MFRRTFSPRLERLENRYLLAFGDDGVVTADVWPNGDDWVEAVGIQSDGKIVAAGNVGLARFNTDGTLDATFDGDGLLPLPSGGYFTDVEIQIDGKIVVGGQLSGDFVVRRFLPDGSSDNSFDGDGIAQTNILKGGSADVAYGIALQAPDAQGRQKIIAVGYADAGISHPRQWAVVRYNANGTLDTTFDGDGKVTTAFTKSKTNTIARNVVVQSDGRIVVVGNAAGVNGSSDFAVVRYNTNGTLDATFGAGGKVTTDLQSEHARTNSNDIARAVVLRADGKLVVVGGVSTGPYFAIVRYNASGALDLSFAGDGKQVLPNPNGQTPEGYEWDGAEVAFRGVALEPPDATGAQKIVAAGSGNANYVARFQSDGVLDTAFDGDGWTWFLFPNVDIRQPEGGSILALQTDGKIVVGGVAGNSATTPPTTYDFAVARLNPDGSFDADGTPCHQGWLCPISNEGAPTASEVDIALLAILAEDGIVRRRRK